MPLVNAKCTNCGATLTIDNNKEAAVCEFCNSAFIVEKAINNYNITHNINANVVNIYNQANNTSNNDFLIESGKLLRYIGNSQEVIIPDEVYIIGNNAFKNTQVKRVVFHKGIVNIEKPLDCDSFETKGAFSGCNYLEEVHIMGIKEIPENAFMGCKSIQKVIIHNGVEVIGKFAFRYCDNLNTIILPKTLNRIEQWAFAFCDSLKEITIPASVQFVACQSFESCKNLEKAIIENGVRSIHGGAFVGCDSISTLHLPKSVSFIENMSLLRCEHFQIIADNPELSKRISSINTKSSGCYIATAVYGSYDCPQVWTLRRYRDNTLEKSWHGRLFIRIYYAISPTLVKWFGKKKWFVYFFRSKLDNIIIRLTAKGYSNTPYKDMNW